MLSSGSTVIWFQPELPGLYILHQEMVIFGIFSKILSNIHQPHLAHQNVTFWRVEQCMSGTQYQGFVKRCMAKRRTCRRPNFNGP